MITMNDFRTDAEPHPATSLSNSHHSQMSDNDVTKVIATINELK